jgi:selenocysteine lyase/cysteine desulfurase
LQRRGVTEVLTLDGEFPSTTVPLLALGLTLRGVRQRPDGGFSIEDLEAALRPATGAVFLSAVQFASGFRIDLEALSALCADRRLPLFVNAAQAIGQVPLDVHRLGLAGLAATSHKWFMGGYGVGLLFLSDDFVASAGLPLAGWLSVPPELLFQTWPGAKRSDDAHGFLIEGATCRREASALDAGGGSWALLHGLDAALRLHEALGVEQTLRHNLDLQLRLRSGLRRRGFVPNAPDDPATMSGICVVPVSGAPGDVVRALLREANIVTTARGSGVRLSTHVFNDEDDVEQLLAAFDRLKIAPSDEAGAG